jgi:hypothetical protein
MLGLIREIVENQWPGKPISLPTQSGIAEIDKFPRPQV